MSDGQVAPARGKEKFGHSLLDVSQFGGAWKTDRTLQDWLVIGKVTNRRTKVKKKASLPIKSFQPKHFRNLGTINSHGTCQAYQGLARPEEDGSVHARRSEGGDPGSSTPMEKGLPTFPMEDSL